MSFLETVQRAGELLRQQGRISLRALKLEFELSDDQAEALVEELVDVQQVAALEGKVLSWLAPATEEGDTPGAIPRAAVREGRAPARAPRDYCAATRLGPSRTGSACTRSRATCRRCARPWSSRSRPARCCCRTAGAPHCWTSLPGSVSLARARIAPALDRAEALATEGGVRAMLPGIAEERGRLAEALGDGAEAARRLRAAQQLFTEFGAEGHAARLARELGR